MNINERIKQVRKEHNLNQKEFGDKVGLKQSAVSSMEQSGGSVIDRNIRLICDTFNINENWLRTGEGDMYAETNESLLNQLAGEYKLEGERLELVKNFLMLTIEQQEAIVRSINILVNAKKKAMESATITDDTLAPPVSGSVTSLADGMPPAPQYPTPPGLELDPIIEDKVKKIRAKLYAQAATQHLFTASLSTENSLENEKSRL